MRPVYCRECAAVLITGTNWSGARTKMGYRICNDCYQVKNREYMGRPEIRDKENRKRRSVNTTLSEHEMDLQKDPQRLPLAFMQELIYLKPIRPTTVWRGD